MFSVRICLCSERWRANRYLRILVSTLCRFEVFEITRRSPSRIETILIEYVGDAESPFYVARSSGTDIKNVETVRKPKFDVASPNKK